MNQVPDQFLKLAPFKVGARSEHRVVLRLADAARYLCTSPAGFTALAELAAEPCGVAEFLGRYMGHSDKRSGLGFRGATELLLALYQSGFVEDGSGEVANRLQEFQNSGETATARRWLARLRRALDCQLVTLRVQQLHPWLAAALALCSNAWYLALLGGVTPVLLLSARSKLELAVTQLGDLLTDPVALVVQGFLGLSVALSSLAVGKALLLKSLGGEFVTLSWRWTALVLPRLELDDDDAIMLPAAERWAYHITAVVLPWLLAALALFCSGAVRGWGAVGSLYAGIWAVVGLFAICPLSRTALVRLAEGDLASLNLASEAQRHLHHGLFTELAADLKTPRQSPANEGQSDTRLQLWMVLLVSWSMLWLYLFVLGACDALLGSIPAFTSRVWDYQNDLRQALAAGVLLFGLGLSLLSGVARLLLIPMQNFAALASVPWRRARHGLSLRLGENILPTKAILGFIKDIPLFADLEGEELVALAQHLKGRRLKDGEWIVKQGDPGNEFFILAEGKAQVLMASGSGETKVLDLLQPGDTFGEIALAERVKRTASVKSLGHGQVLVLGKESFDQLFPQGSAKARELTWLIRRMKLLLESPALSHLPPRAMRELLKVAREREFQAGEYLIRENEQGQAAFLVVDGQVKVVRERGLKELAVLQRGELVGAVALLKDIRRTASVVALSKVTALELDKASFLKVCMSNVFVALLLADQTDRQVANLNAG